MRRSEFYLHINTSRRPRPNPESDSSNKLPLKFVAPVPDRSKPRIASYNTGPLRWATSLLLFIPCQISPEFLMRWGYSPGPRGPLVDTRHPFFPFFDAAPIEIESRKQLIFACASGCFRPKDRYAWPRMTNVQGLCLISSAHSQWRDRC